MPMIDVKLPTGALDEATRAQLAERLTVTLLKWEKAPDNEVTRAITWLWFDERPLYVGGEVPEQARYHVLMSVPEGALSERRKAGLVEEATAVVVEADGGDPTDFLDRLRVWVHIHEVPEGHWGAGGQIFRYRDIVNAVNAGTPVSGTPVSASS